MTDWRHRLANALVPKPSASARKATTGGVWLNSLQNGITLDRLSNDPQERAATFLRAYNVGWFNKAGRKIAGDIANLKVSVSHEDDDGANEAEVIEPDLFTPWEQLDPIGQFLRLMERPNPAQTGRQLRHTTQVRIDFAGWTHWYMEGAGPAGSGQLPTAIYGISPTRLTPSFAKNGRLIGWVLDADGQGGGTPFPANEILTFTNPGAEDSWAGCGVVEAVYAEVPLSAQMALHTSNVLSTGGRLAGMLWPKDRAVDDAEFTDMQRAWRNVSSDPNAAKRLLLFPEPMEYASGASTPAEIGIPELAALNRDTILTAFPISPYQLGVPMPGGLNSAETRREDRRDYWEGTIHPRVELLEETIQVGMMSLYEAVLGTTYDFDIMEPSLDDAGSLMEKAGALAALTAQGFDEESAIKALQLDNIKFIGKPEPVLPEVPVETGLSVSVNDTSRQDATQTTQNVVKSAPVVTARDKATQSATSAAKGRLEAFFAAQRDRVTENIRKTVPAAPVKRVKDFELKAQPTWWDAEFEDAELRKVMQGVYATVGRAALQEVADTLGRFVYKGATQSIIGDLLTYGGERIADINARTLQALTVELAEGTRRGYSLNQLIDGVPGEAFRGVANITLENGTPAFSDLRAETIARTETMLSYNRATVTGYGEFGVTHLLAYDGDDDDACAQRNGQEFTIEEAGGIDDHPNGTLVWSPVVDKARHEAKPEPDPNIILLAEAIKAIATRDPQTVNITNQPPDVHVASPDVHIAPANITVTPASVEVHPPDVRVEPSNVQVDVHVPEAVAPVVNVAAPDAPVVNVASPTVNVAAPVVNVPEQKAPTVNVTTPTPVVNVKAAEAPVVNIHTPDSLRITEMPARMTTRRVTQRTDKGSIAETVDVEEDIT